MIDGIGRRAGEWLFRAVLISALAAPLFSWAAAPAPRIVVFGDSLSDSGNAFALTKENNTPPEYAVSPLLVPDAAYARGGHHLTNGPTWVEELARLLGFNADVQPALRDSSPRAGNYAVAGARAYEDLSQQVQRFLQDQATAVPPSALYVIALGGNDVRDALGALAAGQDPTPILTAGVTEIVASINTLYQTGARNFLVLNAPNIALAPSVRAFGPAAVAAAEQLVQAFNANLQAALASLAGLPGIEIAQFDLYGLTNTVYSNPTAFGIAEVNNPCISPNEPPFVCRNPDTYMFWDGIHPTQAMHEIIAREVAALID